VKTMTITVWMHRWVFKNFEWSTVVGSKLVEVTADGKGLITLRHTDSCITVSRDDLRHAIEALDIAER